MKNKMLTKIKEPPRSRVAVRCGAGNEMSFIYTM